jgi:hypothetical protein
MIFRADKVEKTRVIGTFVIEFVIGAVLVKRLLVRGYSDITDLAGPVTMHLCSPNMLLATLIFTLRFGDAKTIQIMDGGAIEVLVIDGVANEDPGCTLLSQEGEKKCNPKLNEQVKLCSHTYGSGRLLFVTSNRQYQEPRTKNQEPLLLR